MSFIENIKLIASELANMSPRTQLEIVKLCKNLCIETKNYLVDFDENKLPLIDAKLQAHETAINNLDTSINNLNTLYNALADELQTAEGNITANANAIELLNDSVDAITEALDDFYTKSQIDTLLASFYTKTQIDTMLANFYNKTQIDTFLNDKQDKLTAGSGISIVDDVISATGGNAIYQHLIYLGVEDTDGNTGEIRICIYTTSNVQINTISLLRQYVKDFTPVYIGGSDGLYYGSNQVMPLYVDTISANNGTIDLMVAYTSFSCDTTMYIVNSISDIIVQL